MFQIVYYLNCYNATLGLLYKPQIQEMLKFKIDYFYKICNLFKNWKNERMRERTVEKYCVQGTSYTEIGNVVFAIYRVSHIWWQKVELIYFREES